MQNASINNIPDSVICADVVFLFVIIIISGHISVANIGRYNICNQFIRECDDV